MTNGQISRLATTFDQKGFLTQPLTIFETLVHKVGHETKGMISRMYWLLMDLDSDITWHFQKQWQKDTHFLKKKN